MVIIVILEDKHKSSNLNAVHVVGTAALRDHPSKSDSCRI